MAGRVPEMSGPTYVLPDPSHPHLARIIGSETEDDAPPTAIRTQLDSGSALEDADPDIHSVRALSMASHESLKALNTKHDDSDDFWEPSAPWGLQWMCGPLWMRRLMCLGILGVIAAAILVPVAIFVIAPKLAQMILNNANFDFISADILEPNETGFLFHAVAKITNTGPIGANVEFNGPVTVRYKDVPIMTMSIPSLDVVANIGGPHLSASIDTTGQANILNADAFAGFAKAAIFSETFDWRLTGRATGNVFGLHIGVDFDKTLSLKGLDGLKNVTILLLDFPPGPATGGIKLAVTANLFNPSPVGMQLGNIKFNVSVNGTQVGYAASTNVTAKKGDNVVSINGVIDSVKTTEQSNLISKLLGDFLNGQGASFDVIGAEIRPTDPSKPPIVWLQKAFIGLVVPFGLPPLKLDTGLIRKVVAPAFKITFDPKEPWKPKMGAKSVVAEIQLPFVISFSVSSGSLNLKMLSDKGETIASLDSGWIPIRSNISGLTGNLSTDLNSGTLVIADNQRAAFQNLLKTVLFTDGDVNIPLIVTASANATTAAGNISISNITVKQTLPFAGVNGLSGTPIDIRSFDVVTSTPTYIDLKIVAAIVNPSNVAFDLNSDLNFDLIAHNQTVANVNFPNVSLTLGSNVVTAIARYQPVSADARTAGQQLISSFINGESAVVSLRGKANSSILAPLGPAFEAITLSSALPAFTISESFVTGFTFPTVAIEFDPSNPWSPKMSAPGVTGFVKLPWALGLSAKQIQMTINMLDALGSSTAIATLQTGWIPTTSSFTGTTGSLSVSVDGATLNISPNHQQDFVKLLTGVLFGTGTVKIPISALANAVGNVPAVGDISLQNFKYSSSIDVAGLQGLAGTPIVLESFDITGGTADGVTIGFTGSIVNPSSVSLNLHSDVKLQLVYQGQVLGHATLPNLNVVVGTNRVTASALYSPQTDAAKAAGLQLLNSYIAGNPVTVEIKGSPDSSPLPPIAPVLAGVSITGSLPGLTTKLLVRSRMAINPLTILALMVDAAFDATNPTGGQFTVTHMTGDIMYRGEILGTVDADTKIDIAPHATVSSPAIPVKLRLSIQDLLAVFDLLGNTLTASVVVKSISASIGAYPITVSGYQQDNIPVSLVLKI
ncbi:hypothetical protein M427DRAFT_41581 [Gonapodya prolifera JEL478]|uniref:Pre-rRNA processing protein n=1 Tax=Gonapodya prolifera (strain JEL478) TaxID=1344416 RepID=A0A139AUD3_GONPJ|nr:hypothetical protein M427DRAFT_41581 [Gonapodya prolifera JEL478]|eukprot:KXS20341.1 hypothetical protein M427DRAFT_41581 [Gonapodya prolifera JEL478]